MHQVKWLHIALVLLLALGLALPAVAQVRDPRLSNSQVPGSMIVFPKFIYNPGGTATIGGAPRSEFEISVVCPPDLRDDFGCLPPYGEGFRVKIRVHWVCPGSQDVIGKFICRETGFNLYTTLFGTVSFNPANVGAGSFPVIGMGSTAPTVFTPTVIAQRVPVPPCPMGYLIAQVVDMNNIPIKFDALIGNAIMREPSGAISAYNAIPIQAASPLVTGVPIPFISGPGGLAFDGTAYQAVSGTIASSLRFEQLPPTSPTTPYTTVRTNLTLLTLDVDPNAPNLPTAVDLDFFNANEYLLSTFTEFVCWQEIRLTDIDPFLTLNGMLTRQGLVVSGPAQKFPFSGLGIDKPGLVTLLGLVTTEVTTTPATGPSTSSAYTYQLFKHSIRVPTEFAFEP